MKTYTIKPLEWEQPTEFSAYSGNYEIVLWDRRNEESCVKLRRSNVFEEPLSFETIEAAKAKAQELHEAELMKYLQECTVIERNKPVAWMHVMDTTEGYEDAEPYRRLTFDENHPFGVAGEDYSEEYPVISHPLYLQEVTE